jgi:hypothetical protein
VIHQQWKKFAKNIPYHEHKAQHGDGEQHVYDQLATYKSIDQLHLLAQKLAQIGSAAVWWQGLARCANRTPQLGVLPKSGQFANINQTMRIG